MSCDASNRAPIPAPLLDELDALRRTNSLLRAAESAANAGAWAWDIPSGTLQWSEALCRLMGLPPDVPPTLEAWAAALHPADRDAAMDEFRRAVESGTPLESEYRIIRGGGEVRWIHARGSTVFGVDGKPDRLSGLCIDISGKRVAEDGLKQTVARLQAILRSTADGILVVDREGRITEFNDQFATLWNIPAEIIARRDDDLALAHVLGQVADPERFLGKVRELYARAEAESFDVIDFRDGRIFERYSRPLTVDGQATGRVWSFRDVTNARKAERELVQAATQYRIVADHTYDWEFWSDPDGRFLYCSPSCERITGKSREAFLADPSLLEKMVHPEDRALLEAHQQQARCSRIGGELTFRIVRPDGSIRWIEHLCAPLLDGEGRYLGIRGSNRDATGRMETECRLRIAERYEAVGKLAGGVAHRINNLMTVVLGYSAALQRSLPKDDPARVAFEEIEKAGANTSRIVDRLLSYSRLQMFAPRAAEIGALLAGMEPTLRRSAGELLLDISPEPLPVLVDVRQFTESVRELVANACAALPSGRGRIRVRSRRRSVAPGETVATGVPVRPGHYAVVEVEDDGCGMSRQLLEHVFEPFVTTNELGKGLGLPSIYGFAHQSDGYVTIESEPGKGTTVAIYLPVRA